MPGHAEQNLKGRWGSGVKNVKIDNNLVLVSLASNWKTVASTNI